MKLISSILGHARRHARAIRLFVRVHMPRRKGMKLHSYQRQAIDHLLRESESMAMQLPLGLGKAGFIFSESMHPRIGETRHQHRQRIKSEHEARQVITNILPKK